MNHRRFLASVGPANRFGTFGNPRTFTLCGVPEDFRSLTPLQALVQMGWTYEWLRAAIGQEIFVTILDTHIPITTEEASTAPQVRTGRGGWDELMWEILKDRSFMKIAADEHLTGDDVGRLLWKAAEGYLADAVIRVPREDAAKMKTLQDLIEAHLPVSMLYIGIGMTMDVAGQLGAQQVMAYPNGTGFRLTPENHRQVSIGVLTQAAYDELKASLQRRLDR